MIDIDTLDFEKGGGLIPAVIQDADNFQVLMLGYMNEEALKTTLEKERVTFYSRTKERLWTKGETSGNYLELVDLQRDCDHDTLLVLAHPQGPTCHTGNRSCFFRKDFKPKQNLYFLNRLEQLIAGRKSERPEDSYTTHLFEEGVDMIAQKVGEEAVEAIIEAKNDNRDAFVGEVSDLLYHLMVLLAEKDISLGQVVERLEERHRPG
ncbi:phosphoribosyl-ATP pyrophosphatase /phosphoribosyl-AMP cyclohydrolase [Fodinibius roseus]|uniref:Histidine biosynthesis bifunctional protein HisIE n=1 Tax=Fodinibius roseus TaxID=1194090 RepID=A0A1M5I7F0_9BACT|nr:bifunctional phosphoribosyl-AMP cyclohydrolase/phosphoribosyl-ATP diphosphatase HisIE [Fodinibius roseus]SHG24216.1 phosphoribosyl-ATP pyrophosphatase /phosphoribosyl-AMP cyclohydrolase [Fodinibius roseus]